MKQTTNTFELETNTVWSFPKRGKWATHDAKYRGNFSPYIAKNVILRYSKEKGDTQLTWLYIPINVGYDEQYAKKLINKIHSLSSIPIMDDDKHIIWENLDAVLKDADCAKKIKEQYYLLYKKNHNAYSMPVFSGPETIKEKIYEWCEMRLNNLQLADLSIHCWGHCRCFDSCKLLSCLYMGDFEAKNQVNFNALKRILRVGLNSYMAYIQKL